MKRVACYVRVSTEEQRKHGLSVDSQIVALKEYCNKNGYTIVDIYNDAGISARKSYRRRPALMRLISDCKDKKIDLIIFTKLDRYFRSVSNYYQFQAQIDECKVPWRAIWEDYETETSAGIFKVNIMLSLAQAESDRTGERIRKVNEYKRAKGEFVGGKPPTGYIRKDKGLFIDKETEPAVRAFFEAYAQGFGISYSCRCASDKGVIISHATGIRMVKNTTYYGDSNGYKCEAYITQEQYEANQKKLNSKARECVKSQRVYLFAGLLRCSSCGCMMTSKCSFDKHVDGTISYRKAYLCNKHRERPELCDAKHISERRLEQIFLDTLDEELSKYNISVTKQKTKSAFQKKRSTLEAKLKRLSLLFEEGDISVDDYRKKRDEVKAELSLIPSEDVKIVKPLPNDWKEVYSSLDEEHKKAFWNSVLDVVYVNQYNTPVFYFK